jgi:hypothetical protein
MIEMDAESRWLSGAAAGHEGEDVADFCQHDEAQQILFRAEPGGPALRP